MEDILLTICWIGIGVAIAAVWDMMHKRIYRQREIITQFLPNKYVTRKGGSYKPCHRIEVCGTEILKVSEGWEIAEVEYDDLPADEMDRFVILLEKITAADSPDEDAGPFRQHPDDSSIRGGEEVED